MFSHLKCLKHRMITNEFAYLPVLASYSFVRTVTPPELFGKKICIEDILTLKGFHTITLFRKDSKGSLKINNGLGHKNIHVFYVGYVHLLL